MKRTLIRVMALGGVLLLVTVLLPASAEAQTAPLLVSTDWLAKRIEQRAQVIVLHVGTQADYDAGHIPGAMLVAREHFVVSQDAAGRAGEMPSGEALAEWARGLGVTESSHVVVYMGANQITLTTRAFLVMEMLGVKNVSLLDGGLPVWKTESRALSTEAATARKSSFTPKVSSALVAQVDWIKDNLKNPAITVVDSRHTGFYTGESDAQGRIPRPGHIPGAVSLQYVDLLEADGKFKSADSIRALFAQAGIKLNTQVVTYCHTGFQATVGYFVARLLGYKASMYDGSFSEWTMRPDLPVEKSAPITPAKQP